MLTNILRKINKSIPYLLITTGLLVVFLFPLKFYSNNNLNIPTNVSSSIAKAQNRVVGGDVNIGLPASLPITPLAKDNFSFKGELTASSALVIDARSGKVLFSKDSQTVRPLASISKLMSVLVLLSQPIDWNVTTTIEKIDGNGDAVVNVGESYNLEDLWNAALVGSSNRALKAVVRNSGLSSEGFVMLMNKKANELGFNSLNFVEPTGLSEKNVGNVDDVVYLLKETLRFEKIYDSLRLTEYFIKPLDSDKYRRVYTTDWLASNWIVNNFDDEIIVGKTGYIEEAGYNFVTSIKNKQGREIICAVLNSATHESRFTECRDLVEWASDHYVWPYQEEYQDMVE